MPSDEGEYTSYYLRKYDRDGNLLFEGEDSFYTLKVDNDKNEISFCMIDINECFSYPYKKEGKNLLMHLL